MKLNRFWFLKKLKTFMQKIFRIEDTPEKITVGIAVSHTNLLY